MSRWHLAAVTPPDIDAILKIDQKSFKDQWHRKSFSDELSRKDAHGFIVKSNHENRDAQVIAYVFLRIIVSELHILRIAVAPGFRCQGVASWLIKKCFRPMIEKGATSAYIEVRPSNTPAIALYHKLGFKIVGTRPNYYSETNEEALVMKKNLI